MPLFTPSNDPQYQTDLAAGKVPSRGGVPAPPPRLPGGVAGGGGGMSAAFGAGARPMAPGGLPSPEDKAARNAAMVQRYGPNGPPPMGGVAGGDARVNNALNAMARNNAGGPMSRPPMMGAGPPGMPQAARGMPPVAGAKPMAPGGAFGMKQAMARPGPFGQMTKAPMQTGQAPAFTGVQKTRGGNR